MVLNTSPGLKIARNVLIFLLLAVRSVSAQTDPNQASTSQIDEWYLNLPISDIQFEGLKNVAENDLLGVIDSFIGAEFTRTTLSTLQRSLYNLDYFELIIPEAIPGDSERTSLILKFTVEERTVISAIQFNGNQQIRLGTLLNNILLKAGDVVLQSKILVDQESIISLYQERGFVDIEVSFNLEDPDENNAQKLVFFINEGNRTNVQSIKFSGINFATENQLLSVLTTKKQNIFNPGTFQLENLELDRQGILNFYATNGYIDAQILNIEQTVIEQNKSGRRFLEIIYYIDEGIPWFFGGIEFVGNTIYSNEELNDKVFLKPGSVLNLPLFQQGFQAINNLYYQGGYIFNQISLTDERDKAQQHINFTVQIVEASRAYIENVILRGNTKTKEEVILRELPFEVGDVFSALKIREGIGNLYNTQFFANVPVVETPQGSVPGLMNLIINLEEGQTTDIRLGFSIGGGGDLPFAGIAKWTDTNFLGNGQSIGLDVNLGIYEQSIEFNFYDDWLFGRRWSGGFGIGLRREVWGDILQDILYPVFGEDDSPRVPDPFSGYYVFSNDITYNETEYSAGEIFPDVPSTADISAYNLVTDYGYFLDNGGNSADISGDYKMEYVQWNISPSITTGVRRRTQLGWFGFSTRLIFGLNVINYDETHNRPYNYTVRNNLNELQMINSLYFQLSLDNRDIFFNPQNGYLISQAVTYTGGFLGGNRNYIRTDSTIQGYLTLFDIKALPTWSWKLVLAANVSLSFMLDQFFVYGDAMTFEAADQLLGTNGMTIARGWPRQFNGQALFNSWIELRMPISEQVLWLDMYAEAVNLTENRNIFAAGPANWLFGFGIGLRLTIQQFPFRLYLAKRFKIENGQVVWQRGTLFSDPENDSSGLDLIFAIDIF